MVLLCCGAAGRAWGQAGGANTWEFLNLTSSARVASLGGKNVSLNDGDPNMIFHNPALLDTTMNNHLVLNYVSYFAGINYGYASYAFNNKTGNFALGIHYINYGNFTGADAYGNKTGTFTASENSVNLSWSSTIDSLFRIGTTLKGISSSFEQYKSYGMAIDAGMNYSNPRLLLSASFVIKNLGTQFTSWYSGAEKEPLPFEMQAGMTKQLAHAPLRFSLTYQHIENFGLSGRENREYPENKAFINKLERGGKEFLRHLVIGTELFPVQSLSVNAGYNSLRRSELKTDGTGSSTGFSWGFGIQVTRFRISFGQARYHLAGSSNHFSITTDLSPGFN
jgi:hypothetical protein